MASAIRFAWRQYRFEILAMLALFALATIAVQVVTGQLDATRPTACLARDWLDIEVESDPCIRPIEEWLAARPLDMHQMVAFVPLIAGVVLGSVLVSREIEHRTAQVGWSMSAARTTWLFERLIPVALVLVTATGLLSLAAEAHEAAIQPGIDTRASFDNYAARGLPLVMRGLAVFTGAVLAGALIGRQLPALILAGLLAIALTYGLERTFPYGSPGTIVDGEMWSGVQEITDRGLEGGGWLKPDGTIISREEARALSPFPDDDSATWDWLEARFQNVGNLLPGTSLVDVEVRESIILGGLTVAGLAATVLVVARRRPY